MSDAPTMVVVYEDAAHHGAGGNVGTVNGRVAWRGNVKWIELQVKRQIQRLNASGRRIQVIHPSGGGTQPQSKPPIDSGSTQPQPKPPIVDRGSTQSKVKPPLDRGNTQPQPKPPSLDRGDPKSMSMAFLAALQKSDLTAMKDYYGGSRDWQTIHTARV